MRAPTYLAAVAANKMQQVLPKVSRPQMQSEQTIVLTPAAHGSMGDEAMALAAASILMENAGDPLLLTPGPISPWEAITSADIEPWDDLEALGGFLSRWPRNRTLPRSAVVIGADSIDGAYGVRSLSARVSFLNSLASDGVEASLANFSFRDEAPIGALRLLRMLSPNVSLFARDLQSAQRASRLLDREVLAEPDVALFLPPDLRRIEEAQKLVEKVRQGHSAVLGLVVNGHLGDLTLNGRSGTFQYFERLIDGLSEAGFGIIVIAHDVRAQPGDPSLARSLAESKGLLWAAPETAAGAKSLLSVLDICVSARMHAAVGSLSSGVPTIGLDYLSKFVGQFAWYGQDKWVLPATEANASSAINLATELAECSHTVRRDLVFHVGELRRALPSWLCKGGAF